MTAAGAMTSPDVAIDDGAEWLEADGLGGFASGTVGLTRTRRYHALLLTATTPPTGRVVLVSGFDAVVETSAWTCAISSQRYAPDVRTPDGHARIARFTREPWPAWEFDLPDGSRLRQEIVVQHGTGVTLVQWTALVAAGPLTLTVRPFCAGRDYHALMRENAAFGFESEQREAAIRIRPYAGVPAIDWLTTGIYQHAPCWYRQFLYLEEQARGLDAVEDLAAPGTLVYQLAGGALATWMMRAGGDVALGERSRDEVRDMASALMAGERARRASFATPLDRAADVYLVARGRGRSIIAGYPWFTDWGRDTFIAARGLCGATGRHGELRDILLEWAGAVSDGMLPNRFPDRGEAPEFNAVDASLWYVVAVRECLARAAADPGLLSRSARETLEQAMLAIVDGYAAGTRFGIRMDDDALLMAGVDGLQLTWMDARVGDRVITPRIGKPVEVQALWINALRAAGAVDRRYLATARRATAAFEERFWVEEAGHLCDVVDVDHVRGRRDTTFRPNQVLAVGGLPDALIAGPRARRVVDAVEQRLLTPLGLRSLAPDAEGYAAHYVGDGAARDAVYHQGTVWPWLIGPFVDAWLRTRRSTAAARAEARQRFLAPLLAHVERAGLGHVSEIADAEPPFTPRGCPFQAWSLGEVLRVDRVILAEPARRRRRTDEVEV